jgi:hypothetical protein
VTALFMLVEMPVAEFVAIQQASDRDRRRRFGLPATCHPNLTAVRAGRGRIQVLVTCAEPAADRRSSADAR